MTRTKLMKLENADEQGISARLHRRGMSIRMDDEDHSGERGDECGDPSPLIRSPCQEHQAIHESETPPDTCRFCV